MTARILPFPTPRPKRRRISGLALVMAARDSYVSIAASGRRDFTICEMNALIRELRDVRDDARARGRSG